MDRWKQTGPGRIFVSSGFSGGRAIFGVPCLSLGGWFIFKYFILGIVEYARAGDWAGMFSGVLGWVVILAMGGCFLVPGWLLLFFRRAVMIDRDAGIALEMKDFRVGRRVTRHPLDAFHLALVLHERVKGSKSSRWQESVYLVRRDETSLLVGVMEKEDDARALAGALAALLSLSQRVADEDEWMNR